MAARLWQGAQTRYFPVPRNFADTVLFIPQKISLGKGNIPLLFARAKSNQKHSFCPCRGGPPFLAPPRKGAKEGGSRGCRLLRISHVFICFHNGVHRSTGGACPHAPDLRVYPRVLTGGPAVAHRLVRF